MPHRYQVFERIAFSLVVLSAVVCSSFIAYENSPGLQNAVKVTKSLDWTADYSTVCVSPMTGPCAGYPGD
ncbi:hypothetical protein BX592_12877 [Paraburkholderia rhizosphaerae]|uniref:Uncharacterized protein n=1 Tax=Paraburkholderia rhizosphaerae TaxID=480658 RepID=A0A4R8L8L0_9BURK|nr:hypothetical protein [Paraburkholderia rhizosphaerae]TDY39073.1 hypothetical protein BX592_12877 [Paraburkholderia rhizosphaerae]